ncbi:MAG: serine/threonine protein kinase [Chloroflexi bacterium]|nr:MAG: serine/threonine protein kinase [Chloroflexota bacterium]
MKEQHNPTTEQHVDKKRHEPTSSNRDGQVGQSFGNYDLVRRIDVGGMGEVYLACQRTAFGRQVAVKIIRSDLVHDVVTRQRFLREAEVSAHLKHEHILPLVEFGEEQGRLFLVTPYIEGGTLARRLQKGPLSLSEVHQLFTALAQAVAYIHRRGVIHRDLKPSNVLLDQEEGSQQTYVRLIDFGIASLQGSAASPPLTAAKTEVGTVAYMAPERLDGVAAISNDIYSLGIILYQMLTGHIPSKEKAFAAPAPFDTIIRRCLAANPSLRFASAEELLKDFEQAYQPSYSTAQTVRQQPSVVELSPIRPAVPRNEEEPLENEEFTIRRLTASQPMRYIARESSRVLYRTGEIPVVGPDASVPVPNFVGGDYDAPTSTFDPMRGTGQHQQIDDESSPKRKSSRRPKTRKPSLVVLLALSILILAVIIAGLSLAVYQTSIASNITVRPQVQTISKVYTIKAQPGLTSANVARAAIPINVMQETDTAGDTAPTTGKPILCFLPINCPKIVSADDISRLVAKEHQQLKEKLTQKLNQELQQKKASSAGDISCVDTGGTSNPQEGAQSDSVTVTLTEQCSAKFYLTSDALGLASNLLQKDVPAHFQLLKQHTTIGQPVVVRGTDANGAVSLLVPVAGVAQYQFSDTDLQNMQNHIKGMKKKDAMAFIAQQTGVDPEGIEVAITYGGDTLPNDLNQIHVSSSQPLSIPTPLLPPVPRG